MSQSILDERRRLIERLRTAAEILGIAAGYLLALAVCLPEAALRPEGGVLFVSLDILTINVLELLALFGIHLSQRKGHRSATDTERLGLFRELYSRHREILLADVILMVLFWCIFRAQARLVLFVLV